MSSLTVDFKHTLTQSNFSCETQLTKPFIVMSREAIDFNFSQNFGEILEERKPLSDINQAQY